MVGRIRSLGLNGLSVAQFRSAHVKGGIAVVSLTVPRHPLSPLLAVAAAAAVTVGLVAAPGLADQVRDNEWWLTEVHVTKAWPTSRGAGVTVAVLDTGVNSDQPDLAGSVTTGPDYTLSGRRPGDANWGTHGTAMAVIIAGHGHGAGFADGILGVAPKVKIMSIRVALEELDPLRTDAAVASKLPAAIAAGIRYAVRHGAKVIDLPLDPGAAYADGTPGAAGAAGGATAERTAVSYALAKGAVLVAPAGDDGPRQGRVSYPAAYPGVIAVGAFDRTFTKSSFSSRLSYVTLTAPGGDIITATPGTGYTTVSSTSAASAVVAGMAALIRARYPGLTPRQVRHALTQGTLYQPVNGRTDGSGFGTADAALALSAAGRIQAAAHATAQPAGGRATRSGSPSQAGPTTISRRTSLIRDALIGGAGLLLLFSLALALQLSRRRRQDGGQPPYTPQPTRSAAARTPDPEVSPQEASPPWEAPASEPQRPPLGQLPNLTSGPPTPPAEGPPWAPAPKPKTEPIWEVIESATNGAGIASSHTHQESGMNGRSDARWRDDPGALGPSGPRDPASRPVGAVPPSDSELSDPAGSSDVAGSSDTGRPYSSEVAPRTARRYGAEKASDPSWPYGTRAHGAAEPSGAAADFGATMPRGTPGPSGGREPPGAGGREPASTGGSPGATDPHRASGRSRTGEGTPEAMNARGAAPADRAAVDGPPSAASTPAARAPEASPSAFGPLEADRPPGSLPVATPPAAAPPTSPAAAPPAVGPAAAPPTTSRPVGRSDVARRPPPPQGQGRHGEDGHPAAAGFAAPRRPDDLRAPTGGEQAAGHGSGWNPGAKTEDFRAVSSGLRPSTDRDRSWAAGSLPYSQPAAAEEPGLASPSHAVPGAETQAFPVILPVDPEVYPDEDDEDDRHL